MILLAIAGWMPGLESQTSASTEAKTYQEMSLAERGAIVSEQAKRISRELSGHDYQFTPAFEAEIQKSVDFYARRVGNGGGDQLGKGEARFIFERAQTVAPTIAGIFRAQNVSPVIGIYLPFIESEYMNIQTANEAGAVGMFQFLPKTGEHFGLTGNDLLDVPKSADAAARYIANGLRIFKDDPMKEALAILSYNRGVNNVQRDLTLFIGERDACSICTLTQQRARLDKNFQSENVYYVPRFFAAAIVGENPQAFGLQIAPLSSL
jgi:hypothetical protein